MAPTRAVLLFCVHYFYYDEQLMLLFLGLFKLCIPLWVVLCLPISHLLEIIDFSFSSECTLLICCFFNSFVILYFFKCCVVPVSHDFSITWWLLQEPFCFCVHYFYYDEQLMLPFLGLFKLCYLYEWCYVCLFRSTRNNQFSSECTCNSFVILYFFKVVSCLLVMTFQ